MYIIDKSANSSKQINIGDKTKFTLNGADKDNYSLTVASNGTKVNNLTGTVDKATLTVSASATNRAYNRLTAVALTSKSISGWIAADTMSKSLDDATTGTLSGAIANKNAGDNKKVTLSGLTLKSSGGYENYKLVYDTTKTVNIAKKALTLDGAEFDATTRTYDATKAVTVAAKASKDGLTDGGIISGDTVTLNLASGAFVYNDKSANSSKQINIGDKTKFTLNGADKDNYSLTVASNGTKVNNLTGTVDKATLTVSASATNRTYNRLTAVALTSKTISGWVAADTMSKSLDDATTGTLSGAIANKNAGDNRKVTLSGLTLKSSGGYENYKLVYDTTKTVNIAKKALTLDGAEFDATTRTYDATKAVTVAAKASKDGFTDGGIISGDTVTFNLSSGAFVYNDKSANSSKQINIGDKTKFTLNGADKDNYSLVVASNGTKVNNLTGTVNKATLTVSASATNRAYDGKTAVALTNKSISGWISADSMSKSLDDATTGTLSGAIANKNASDGRKVTLSGLTLKSSGGYENYKLVYDTTQTVNITKKALTLDGKEFSAMTRTYDGTKKVKITIKSGKDGLTDGDIINGDKIKLTVGLDAFVYKDKNSGNNKQINIGDKTKFTLDGDDKSNYKLSLINNSKVVGLTGTVNEVSSQHASSSGRGGAAVALAVVGGGASALWVVTSVGAAAAKAKETAETNKGKASKGVSAPPQAKNTNVFDTIMYAKINGLNMAVLSTPLHMQNDAEKMSVFNQIKNRNLEYNVKYTATYDLALLGNNIKAQKVTPLHEPNKKTFDNIKDIFVKQSEKSNKVVANPFIRKPSA